MAYPSVVAGGTDSCTIHYLRNNKASLYSAFCTCCPSRHLILQSITKLLRRAAAFVKVLRHAKSSCAKFCGNPIHHPAYTGQEGFAGVTADIDSCCGMQRVRDGELMLMDAGCELHGYCSDVTRTWPVSGTYTKHQRAIYEIVLDAQRYLLPAEPPAALCSAVLCIHPLLYCVSVHATTP